MFELLGVARDAGSGGGGNNGEELAAKDLATALSGIAKTVLCSGTCSGGGGKGKAGTRGRAVRATSRAVHLYPGEPSSWRYLARAMVSSVPYTDGAGLSTASAICSLPRWRKDCGMVRAGWLSRRRLDWRVVDDPSISKCGKLDEGFVGTRK